MREKEKVTEEISVNAVMDQPETAFELINKYGTYEIQPTADTENEFPHIAQGQFIKKRNKNHKNN